MISGGAHQRPGYPGGHQVPSLKEKTISVCDYHYTSYPQFIVKKFPFVFRDKTDWAIDAVPKATKTKVPAKKK